MSNVILTELRGYFYAQTFTSDQLIYSGQENLSLRMKIKLCTMVFYFFCLFFVWLGFFQFQTLSFFFATHSSFKDHAVTLIKEGASRVEHNFP